MYKFIQRNQKKMLAIFGVLLMIVFVLPSTLTRSGYGNPPVGRMAGDGGKIRINDVQQAKHEVDELTRLRLLPLLLGIRSQFDLFQRPQLGQLFQGLHQQLDQHPEVWVMLVREAEQAGIHPSDQQVRDLIQEHVNLRDMSQAEIEDRVRPAVTHLLMVRSSFERYANSMKATRAQIQHSLSASQGLRLNVVELKADEFVGQVPEPTAEQIQQHYDVHKNDFGGTPRNPYATTQPVVQSGYRVADQVKLQYVQIPAEQVLDAFLKQVSADERYELSVAAARYYNAHKPEFTVTPEDAAAATDPTTAPATGPTAGPATRPASGPTTKPLAEVEPQLLRRIVTSEISVETNSPRTRETVQGVQRKFTDFRTNLRNELRDQLQKDYAAYKGPSATPAGPAFPGGPTTGPTTGPATGPSTRPTASATTSPAMPTTGPADVALATTRPTTGPATAPAVVQPLVGTGEPFEQIDYLKNLADQFEKKHGVRPLVNSVTNEWQTEQKLDDLPGIGSSRVPDGESFPDLATRRRERIQRIISRTTQPSAEPEFPLFEPSPVLTDRQENAYLFRVTAWYPEHVPPLEEVREQVVKDLRTIAAYDRARSEAQRLLDAARYPIHGATTAPTTGPSTNPSGGPTVASVGPTTGPSTAPVTDAPGGLPAAARAAGRTALSVGPISNLNQVAPLLKNPAGRFQPQLMQALMQIKVPGYEFPNAFSEGKTQFLTAIAPLQEQLSPGNRHPARVVELPSDRKALAVEVAEPVFEWPEDQDYRARLFLAQRAREDAETALAFSWFNHDSVVERVQYTPEERPDKASTRPAGK